MITRKNLIDKYLNFFKRKRHEIIPSSSLIPENDPTVLFTTAGMHPLVPYIIGNPHPLGRRLTSVQKCIRTGDINEVGDTAHHTFFEMLGNWSLGDYWKEEAISFSYEFLTKELKIPINKLAISCFKGDKDAKKDEESANVWLSLGIPKERIAFLPKEDNWWGPAGKTGPCGPDTEMFYWAGKKPAPKKFNPKDKNWVEIWNDVFMQYNKTEIKYILVDAIKCLINDKDKLNQKLHELLQRYRIKKIIVTNDKKRVEEVLQNFNTEETLKNIEDRLGKPYDIIGFDKNPSKDNPEFFKKLLNNYNLKPEEVIYFDHKKDNLESAKKAGINKAELYKNPNQIEKFIEGNRYYFIPLKQKNVDTGMGVERTLAILNNLDDNYLTEIWKPIIVGIEKLANNKYKDQEKMRIIADHVKASVFILAEGVTPSNRGRGYVLRRLIRRSVRLGQRYALKNFMHKVAEPVFKIYSDYAELEKNRNFILTQLDEEENKFNNTIERGLMIFNKKIIEAIENKGKTSKSRSMGTLTGKEAFLLYQSYGFPLELIEEECKKFRNLKFDRKGFESEMRKHQELSRTQSAGVFKSGLADSSEATTHLHTATHLLNEALRRILGQEVKQRGSNITPERLRFDFNFPRKITDEEIKKVQDLVNGKISEGLEVIRTEEKLQDALKSGAQAEFGHKYPEKVSVYTIIDKKEKGGWFSKEICTGPHVKNTKEIGYFKIIKEESVAAGVRRIKAIVKSKKL